MRRRLAASDGSCDPVGTNTRSYDKLCPVPYTAGEIAAHVGGTVVGDAGRRIDGVSSPASAGPRDLIFIDSRKYLADLRLSKAGAALLAEELEPPPAMTAICVPRPALAMAQAIDLMLPRRRTYTGVSPAAHIGRGVALAPDVGIGPNVCIGDDVAIGSRTEIHPGVTIGRGTTIGEDCLIYAGVHIYHDVAIGSRVILHSGAVIGSDGFGFVPEPGDGAAEPWSHRKIAQLGRVVLEDDVEIGANSAIDRAAFDATVIGRGTKIDNLVTVGHNSRLGRHCLVVGQAGISGSTVLGDYVTVAGQAGLTGHLRIGSHVVIGSQAGVIRDIADDGVVLGSPATDAHEQRKIQAVILRLPQLRAALAGHGRRLAELEHQMRASLQGG